MNIKDLIESPSGIIEKARESRYLVLILVFILFSDFSLLVFKDKGLLELTVYQMKHEILVGQWLFFLGSLSLFLAFITPLFKYLITFIAFSFPASFLALLGLLKEGAYSKDRYANISDLERDAVLENNEVKYMFIRRIENSRMTNNQIEFYCLCLFILVIFGFILAPDNKNSITYWLCYMFLGEHEKFVIEILQILLWFLLWFCFHAGVYEGCLKSKWGEYKVYFPNYYKHTLSEQEKND